jgi:sugar lactone lactonase YvrE
MHPERTLLPLFLLTGLVLQFGCQGKGGGSGAAPARVSSVTATPAQVGYGETSTLAWTVAGAPNTLLLADDLSGAAPREVSGLASLVVNPVRRQTFALMAGSDPASAAADPNPARVTVAAKGLDLLAGNPGGPGNLDGVGARAYFASPEAVAVAADGTIFVADSRNQTIRRIAPDGAVTTVAGKAGEAGFQDGPGAQARFMFPTALVLDSRGSLLIADTNNNAIRVLAADGTVTTLAGDPSASATVDGTGREARFWGPDGLALDPAGTLYVSEFGGDCIRKVTPAGVVTTFAGQPGQYGFQDGPAAQAQFRGPQGLALDASGNLLVADSANHLIRQISPAGVVSTLAGVPGQFGSLDGPAREAEFDYPTGLAVDAAGAVFVCGRDSVLRRIGSDGRVTSVAGVAREDGSQDGVGTEARFDHPKGLALDPAGNLLVADRFGNAIRRLERSGRVSTVAGSGSPAGYAEGRGAAARFDLITASAIDAAGNTYVADLGSRLIRRITPAGVTSTVAGTLKVAGYKDGPAAQAEFGYISALAVARDGTLYLADNGGCSIRAISPEGQVSTLAGPTENAGSGGIVDGTGAAARFQSPFGIVLDDAGNLYVADQTAVRKVTPAGVVTTLAWTDESKHLDGAGGAARFAGLTGLARDAQGNLFLAESGTGTIRKLTPDGVVSTLAGDPEADPADLDGTGAEARFRFLAGLTIDPQGNLYAAEYASSLIRKITPAGVVTTVAGAAGQVGLGIGPLPGAFSQPHIVLATPAGDLLVVQANCVAQITLPD